MGDGMAGGAGDTRMGGWMPFHIEVGVVELTAEEGYGIMATGTEA